MTTSYFEEPISRKPFWMLHMKVPYSKGRRDAKMTDAGDFQPSGTTDSATERERGGERNWPPNPADFLRIKGLLIVTRSLLAHSNLSRSHFNSKFCHEPRDCCLTYVRETETISKQVKRYLETKSLLCHFRGHEALKYSAAPRSGNDIMYSTSRRIR